MSRSQPVRVSDLVLTEGQVAARAADRWGRHRVLIQVAGLTPQAWERILTLLAADPSLLAAVLDDELPAALVEAAESGRRTLEPLVAETNGRCGCNPWSGRCAHIRAVRCEMRAELRRRPAVALTLRGRDVDRLAREACEHAALTVATADPGVDAQSAYERSARGLAPLADVPTPTACARPNTWLGPDALSHQRLLDQATDAAERALAILVGTGDGGLALDLESDLARIAAGLPSHWDVDHLAWRAGLRPALLRRRALAWKNGGQADTATAARVPVPFVLGPEPHERERSAASAPQQLSLVGLDA